jgi:hypothetical protein
MVEEFSADLRTVKHISRSTQRGYHSALRAFTSYISNPDYGWDRISENLSSTRTDRRSQHATFTGKVPRSLRTDRQTLRM